jgi:hypothetical protein
MADAGFDDLDMAAARAKFAAKVDGRKVARKTRQKKTADAVDGRSLRATGRTEHLNFKASPKIKEALAKYVPRGKTSLWLEGAIIEKLQREGIDLDA